MMRIDLLFFLDPEIALAIGAGLVQTIVLFVLSTAGAILHGSLVVAIQLFGPAWSRKAVREYVTFLRNVPLLIFLFFFYFGLVVLFPANQYPIMRWSELGTVVVIFTISLVLGAFVSQVFRAGIEAVPYGQMEAALSSGLSRQQALRHVILPQLLPIILPGLCTEVVNVLKSTALALTIGVTDLMWQAQRIESETLRGVETMTAISILYFALAAIIFGLFRVFEHLARIPGTRS